MQVERPSFVSRTRDNKTLPAKRCSPVAAKNTVSAAGIFKRTRLTKNDLKDTPHANRRQDKGVAEDASVTKSGSRLRSSHKVEKRIARRRSDIHPLTSAFKDTSEDYRRNLYTVTSQAINETLVTLLHKLHESTLQPISTHGNTHDLQASPLRLTAPVKYERMAMKLYQPLSHYKLSLYNTNAQGERQRFESTLAIRMEDYEDHIARRTEEVARLQNQWEMIVGEIWKLGVTCLGQDTMERLLITQDGKKMTSGFPPDPEKADSTLFVPEHGGSTPPRGHGRSTKRVTFQVSETPSRTSESWEFLHQPSRYPKESLPSTPPLPKQEVRRLTKNIKELGGVQVEDLHKIGREKQQFWKRKTMLIMQSLAEE